MTWIVLAALVGFRVVWWLQQQIVRAETELNTRRHTERVLYGREVETREVRPVVTRVRHWPHAIRRAQ